MARELSRKNTKRRLARRINMDVIRRDVEMIKPVDEWDWEELQRGYPRGETGKFGPMPRWAPLFRSQDEVQKRLRKLTASHLRAHAGEAVKVLIDLMKDDATDLDGKPLTPASVRLKAAELVLNHTIGLPTKYVEVEAGDALSNMLAACLVNDDGDDAHPAILPGELVIDDEEDL